MSGASVYGLSAKRGRRSEVTRTRIDDIADSDRGKVLFSAPLRRLQNKAQVFALERDAAIRSRLTHSLEVSSIGRYIAQTALAERGDAEPKLTAGEARAFITFVETACLAHDLGNPPFGHFGEHAISEWFANHEHGLCQAQLGETPGTAERELWDRHYLDFKNFDGNPQGFRIVGRLQSRIKNDAYGLNLTLTQLGALLKYPWSCEWIATQSKKKGGYFQTEADLVKDIRDEFAMVEGQRHPLVYLMEAADDIAYCLSDLEDGMEKGLVDPRAFGEYMQAQMAGWLENLETKLLPRPEIDGDIQTAISMLATKPTHGHHVHIDPFTDFRSAMIRTLVGFGARAFVDHHDKIVGGTHGDLLGKQYTETMIEPALLLWVKNFVAAHLYQSRIVKHREITAHKVVSGLLDAHSELLLCPRERFEAILRHDDKDGAQKRITVESGKISRFPKKYVQAYETAVRAIPTDAPASVLEWSHRAHLLVDYVSGMTDEYALSSYHLLLGMKTDLQI